MSRHCIVRLLCFFMFLGMVATSLSWAGQNIRVGIYQNSPKVAISDSGRPEGIFIDILEFIAAEEGWSLEYVPGTWSQGLARLETGQIDLMPDVALTQSRQSLYAFNQEPVLSDWFQVYAPRGSAIRSILDLDGKRVALLEHSIQQEAFGEAMFGFDMDINLVPYSEYSEAFASVHAGKTDAVIANRFYGGTHTREHQLEDTAIIFSPTRLYFAAPPQSDLILLDAIDEHLLRLKRNPTSLYYRSLQRWTSEKVEYQFPTWFRPVGIGAVLMLSLSIVWSVILGRQVEARTRTLVLRNEELLAMYKKLESSEQALRSSEGKYRMLFETANDAILLMHQGRFEDCNARTLSMFGCSREQILGAEPREFSPPFQSDGCRSEQKAQEKITLALHEGPQFFDWQHCRRDGTPFMAEVSLNRLDLDGEIRLQAIVRDVTERRQAEEDIRELNASLEQRVAERTAELAIARDRAEAADRVKSAFLATMSHELRTPLNSIIGFTGIILQELAGPLNAEQRKQLEMVRKSAHHLLTLINDVLDISKIEAGQLEVSRDAFDLRASIEKVLDIIKPLAEKKNLILRTNLTPETGMLVNDERRVEQVLLNLLNNAVKFTDQGEIALSSAILYSPEPVVQLSVRDTGLGIKQDDLATLFTPFKQIDSGLQRNYEGTGLGLAICKRLTELMGGRIFAESEWGKGSVFTVVLPLNGAKNL